ncbi:hypothetical protein ACQCSX_22130 (plasmid) [Pseudarthrobacter sp. P1]|uniref:hypothetical protein n=1 Tax=Pseudarthrobacter sp. P1 TaxID=3418418 RepID=UPI003CEFB8FA
MAISTRAQAQRRIIERAIVEEDMLRADSAITGARRQFPVAFAGALLVKFRDDASGRLEPVGVSAYNRDVAAGDSTWMRYEAPETPGCNIASDLGSINPENVRLLKLTNTGQAGVFAMPINRGYHKEVTRPDLTSTPAQASEKRAAAAMAICAEGEEAQVTMRDLLTDLRHHADKHGIDLNEAFDESYKVYIEEKDDQSFKDGY